MSPPLKEAYPLRRLRETGAEGGGASAWLKVSGAFGHGAQPCQPLTSALQLLHRPQPAGNDVVVCVWVRGGGGVPLR